MMEIEKNLSSMQLAAMPPSSSSSSSLVLTLVVLFFFTIAFTWYWNGSRRNQSPPPPGPRGLPLLGYLPFLDPQLHLCLARLAKSYGPILQLRLGTKLCVVLSSPSAAKEVLKDQDATFANRDVPTTAKALTYGGVDIAWADQSPQWRLLRKIVSREMMSNPVLNSCYSLRRRNVHQMLRHLRAKAGTPINVAELIFATSLDVLTSMLWGGSVHDEEQMHRIGSECRRFTEEAVELLGKPNISDFFPALATFDLQGLGRKMTNVWSWFDRMLDSVIDQRQRLDLEASEGDKKSKDFLHLMLKLKEEADTNSPLPLTHIKAVFMDVLVGGTDTTATTIEWAMAEVMKHPETMRKAQQELEEVVGLDSRVEETHLPKLQFVSAILKEALRLHPPVPLLVPRTPIKSCQVGGYTISKGVRVLVNAWAIHRDPEAWDDPLEFRPERFLDMGGRWDSIGNDFRYLPFGSGRRKCVGVPLAEKMLVYLLASLLHYFQWRLPRGIESDLTEKFGIVLKKATPLVVIPTPRLSNPDLYS